VKQQIGHALIPIMVHGTSVRVHVCGKKMRRIEDAKRNVLNQAKHVDNGEQAVVEEDGIDKFGPKKYARA